MTRYSDLIAHFQKLIEKEGDRPFARNDGPWTCGFFIQQVTSENRKLNKAIHRKNRHIDRLRKQNDELRNKDWITLDPGNASVETLKNLMVAMSELHLKTSGSGLEFKSDGCRVTATPIK